MADKFKTTFQVYTNNADSRKLAKPGALFAYFIEAASMHAERLGIGHKSLQDNHNAFWALSKVHFDIYQTPVWHQKVTVTTWPSGYNRLFARRYFQIADEDGTLLADGASDWVIMSFENRILCNVQSIVESIAQFNLEQEHLNVNTAKVPAANSETAAKTTRRVMFSDLDMNKHLTKCLKAKLVRSWASKRATVLWFRANLPTERHRFRQKSDSEQPHQHKKSATNSRAFIF